MNVTGAMVKEARLKAALSQESLGRKIGESRFTMVRIEKLERVDPDIVPKLDKVFGSTKWRVAQKSSLEAMVAQQTVLLSDLIERVERLETARNPNRTQQQQPRLRGH